jgi:hypothetical protein
VEVDVPEKEEAKKLEHSRSFIVTEKYIKHKFGHLLVRLCLLSITENEVLGWLQEEEKEN